MLERLRQIWNRQKSARLLVYVRLMGLALLLVVYLDLRDRATESAAQAARLQADLVAMADLDDGAVWLERARAAAASGAHWQAAQWRATTPGVAAARIQEVLEGTARQAGFEAVSVQVAAEPLRVDGAAVLRFDFNGRAAQSALVELLAFLSIHSPRLIVTDVTANFTGRRSNLRLSGIAPYSPPPPASASEPDAVS